MLNFLLAIIIFIAHRFPPTKAKSNGQQAGGFEKKVGDARVKFPKYIKVVSESQTPKPCEYESATEVTPGDNRPFEIANAYGHDVACDSATEESASFADIKGEVIDVSIQTEDAVVSEKDSPHTLESDVPSPFGGAVVKISYSCGSPAPATIIEETQHIEMTTRTPEDYLAYIRPSSNPTSEATLVNTPTESLALLARKVECRGEDDRMVEGPKEIKILSSGTITLVNDSLNSMTCQRFDREFAETSERDNHDEDISESSRLSPRVQNSMFNIPLEKTESASEDAREDAAAVQSNPTVHEEQLRSEIVAHQQTQEELARSETWCRILQAEKETLQAQVDDVGRESARIRRRVNDTEDENIRLNTDLFDALGRIRELTSSAVEYQRMIQGLQTLAVNLEADVAWYTQLGTDFYLRLQEAERVLHPADRVFVVYQRLVRDAAQYFSKPVEAGDENGDLDGNDGARFEEINDVDEEDAYPHRPMRPGTTSRVPLSVFAVDSVKKSNDSPSSVFEDQLAPPHGNSAFPISFGFADHAIELEKKNKTFAAQEPAQNVEVPKTSIRGRSGRGVIEPGKGSRRRGTNPCAGPTSK